MYVPKVKIKVPLIKLLDDDMQFPFLHIRLFVKFCCLENNALTVVYMFYFIFPMRF